MLEFVIESSSLFSFFKIRGTLLLYYHLQYYKIIIMIIVIYFKPT